MKKHKQPLTMLEEITVVIGCLCHRLKEKYTPIIKVAPCKYAPLGLIMVIKTYKPGRILPKTGPNNPFNLYN